MQILVDILINYSNNNHDIVIEWEESLILVLNFFEIECRISF